MKNKKNISSTEEKNSNYETTLLEPKQKIDFVLFKKDIEDALDYFEKYRTNPRYKYAKERKRAILKSKDYFFSANAQPGFSKNKIIFPDLLSHLFSECYLSGITYKTDLSKSEYSRRVRQIYWSITQFCAPSNIYTFDKILAKDHSLIRFNPSKVYHLISYTLEKFMCPVAGTTEDKIERIRKVIEDDKKKGVSLREKALAKVLDQLFPG